MGSTTWDAQEAGERAMASSQDPRAVRTRAKLVEAFSRLATTHEPRDLTVATLTEEAGVHRSVFYKHFASPDDLAVHMLRDLFSALSSTDVLMRRDHAMSGLDASRNAMRDLVRHVGARRDLYASLLGPNAPTSAVQSVVEAFAEWTREAIENISTRPATVQPDVVSRFLAHGVLGVVGAWLNDPHSHTSDDQVVDQLMLCFPAWLVAAPSDPPPGTPPRSTPHHEGRR